MKQFFKFFRDNGKRICSVSCALLLGVLSFFGLGIQRQTEYDTLSANADEGIEDSSIFKVEGLFTPVVGLYLSSFSRPTLPYALSFSSATNGAILLDMSIESTKMALVDGDFEFSYKFTFDRVMQYLGLGTTHTYSAVHNYPMSCSYQVYFDPNYSSLATIVSPLSSWSFSGTVRNGTDFTQCILFVSEPNPNASSVYNTYGVPIKISLSGVFNPNLLYSYTSETFKPNSGSFYYSPFYSGTWSRVTYYSTPPQSSGIPSSGKLTIEMPCSFSIPSRTYFCSSALDMTSEQHYNIGYKEGNVYGYESGYNAGYVDGEGVGYDKGYDQGVSDQAPISYKKGYDIGKSEGLSAAEDGNMYAVIGAVIDAPVGVVKDFLSFEILGVNMLGFFSGILTLLLVSKIIRKLL